MSTLILVEHDNQNMHPATRNLVSASRAFTQEPTLLIIGYGCDNVARDAAKIKGVGSVLCIDNSEFEHQLPENIAVLLQELADSFEVIMANSSTFGKNILPRVAALLDVCQVSDVTKIIDKDTFEHPIYAGNAIETVKVLDPKKILTIRPTAFDPEEEANAPCSIETLDKSCANNNAKLEKRELSKSTRPELGQAHVVVSGGRALQSADKFVLIEQLADALGGAVGASRAAVDAGFVSNDYQVGQTGKIVAPELYIAVGISGAVQHLAGMKDSKIIVAINKDEDAPIFQIATYGLVGDLFEIIPELIEKLKSL